MKVLTCRRARCAAHPAVPGDDLTTLRVNYYLVAQKKLDNDLIGDLTEALLNARRDLLGELPILAQLSGPQHRR